MFSLIKKNNFPELYSKSPFEFLTRDIDNLFDSSSVPRCRLDDSKDAIFVSVDLPGVNKDDVKIELLNGILTVEAERKSEINNEDCGHNELFYGRSKRLFQVGDKVDGEQVDAKLENGVLKIRLKKKENVSSKIIKIS